MAVNMDKQTLEYIMRGLTARDRSLQRHVADTYLAPDVKLTHMLGDVEGHEALYGVYRAAVSGIDYKLQIVDMVVSPEECKAACWVDLNIKMAPFYLKRYHAPTIVMLRWRRCEDGLYRICEQIDHHSFFTIMWAFGWPLSSFYDLFTRRITGRMMSLTGWGVDAVEDAAAAALNLGSQALGWGLTQALPALVLQSVTQVLPEGWVGRLGIQQPEGVKDGWQQGVQGHAVSTTSGPAADAAAGIQ